MILGNYYIIHDIINQTTLQFFLPDITKTHFSFTKTRYTNF